jgi:hypothetical protein
MVTAALTPRCVALASPSLRAFRGRANIMDTNNPATEAISMMRIRTGLGSSSEPMVQKMMLCRESADVTDIKNIMPEEATKLIITR